MCTVHCEMGHDGQCFGINGTMCVFFFFNDTATTEIYTLSLHDALPILHILYPVELHTYTNIISTTYNRLIQKKCSCVLRSRSEEHTSELQSRETISYAVFCLKKKKDHLTILISIPQLPHHHSP